MIEFSIMISSLSFRFRVGICYYFSCYLIVILILGVESRKSPCAMRAVLLALSVVSQIMTGSELLATARGVTGSYVNFQLGSRRATDLPPFFVLVPMLVLAWFP